VRALLKWKDTASAVWRREYLCRLGLVHKSSNVACSALSQSVGHIGVWIRAKSPADGHLLAFELHVICNLRNVTLATTFESLDLSKPQTAPRTWSPIRNSPADKRRVSLGSSVAYYSPSPSALQARYFLQRYSWFAIVEVPVLSSFLTEYDVEAIGRNRS
jgi:hypothetical protein